jgi:hypothetical protein
MHCHYIICIAYPYMRGARYIFYLRLPFASYGTLVLAHIRVQFVATLLNMNTLLLQITYLFTMYCMVRHQPVGPRRCELNAIAAA